MRNLFYLAIVVILASCTNAVSNETSDLKAPVTKKTVKIFNEHGGTRTDDYFWLNDPKDSAVINHLKEENAYMEAYMKHTEGLQKEIYNELVARIDQKAESVPRKANGYWYYTRYEEGKQYPLFCRKKNDLSAAEEVFLNVPEMAQGHQIFQVRGW